MRDSRAHKLLSLIMLLKIDRRYRSLWATVPPQGGLVPAYLVQLYHHQTTLQQSLAK